ncbi:hypothetical protein BDK51DRAFT_34633 [Blyttiomyces helicus]|uniref:Tho complex subunit 7-domain-containing protein n=1 Tax=Blyttiomyces helicus TaxID=388810 RepID=A0A4P9WFL7_9FUNG|nr:hypothetical protein BDK51DRAFT_34633 [Blyttiomyces helicus]|eukprot:RKO89810.1 hypothetical protein BDK51DRAFT_34633 [Blyttiomyces helicus]
MNAREVARYEEMQKKIEEQIDQANSDIASLKEQLEEAQKQRKNKLEYDVLAKTITKVPSREESIKKADGLSKEIAALTADRAATAAARERRKRHMYALATCLHDLQDSIADDRKTEDREAVERASALAEAIAAPRVISHGDGEEEEEGVLAEDGGEVKDHTPSHSAFCLPPAAPTS